MQTLPSLFISHGSPMIALDPREAGRFMQGLGPRIERLFGKSRAMLIASAHTLASQPVLLAAPRHAAVYDFGGFDPRLRTLRYDVEGAPDLARQARALLQRAGIEAGISDDSGLDHGIWTALRQLLPAADVPVLPLAWPAQWPPSRLFELGRALAPLAAEGVLIIGSGSITHNLRRVFGSAGMTPIDKVASLDSTAFRDWFADRTSALDWPALLDYRRTAPHAVEMHPTDEHLLPFFIAGGAGDPLDPPHGLRIHASLTHGELGMDAYAFGSSAPSLLDDAAVNQSAA
jgi:4,5-DOPA dioxygenase extradiol